MFALIGGVFEAWRGSRQCPAPRQDRRLTGEYPESGEFRDASFRPGPTTPCLAGDVKSDWRLHSGDVEASEDGASPDLPPSGGGAEGDFVSDGVALESLEVLGSFGVSEGVSAGFVSSGLGGTAKGSGMPLDSAPSRPA